MQLRCTSQLEWSVFLCVCMYVFPPNIFIARQVVSNSYTSAIHVLSLLGDYSKLISPFLYIINLS